MSTVYRVTADSLLAIGRRQLITDIMAESAEEAKALVEPTLHGVYAVGGAEDAVLNAPFPDDVHYVNMALAQAIQLRARGCAEGAVE